MTNTVKLFIAEHRWNRLSIGLFNDSLLTAWII